MLISGRLSATLAYTGANLVTVQRREDFVNNGNEYGGESCKARDGCAIAADPSATLSSSSIPVETSVKCVVREVPEAVEKRRAPFGTSKTGR